MWFFFAGPFFESFYDLGLKKGGPSPKSRVGPLSESDNTLCEWGNIWDWKKVVCIPGWSALWGGPIPGLHCTCESCSWYFQSSRNYGIASAAWITGSLPWLPINKGAVAISLNLSPTKLSLFNFHPLEVVSRYCNTQLQVVKITYIRIFVYLIPNIFVNLTVKKHFSWSADTTDLKRLQSCLAHKKLKYQKSCSEKTISQI